MFEEIVLNELNKVYPNGITVVCSLNEDARAIVQFSSNHVSTLNDFLARLNPVLRDVLRILRNTTIPMKVVPYLSFANQKRQATLYSNLNDFNINDVFDMLRFNTNAIDGGYFELEIIHMHDYNPFRDMYRYNQRQNDDDDSQYITLGSDDDDDDA